MPWWPRRQQRSALSREALLQAIPLRKPAVREVLSTETALRLSVPWPRNRLGRWLTRSDEPVWRQVELDSRGATVWRLADGRANLDEVIDVFAAEHQWRRQDAEAAMRVYMRTLMSRGIVTLIFPPDAGESRPA